MVKNDFVYLHHINQNKLIMTKSKRPLNETELEVFKFLNALRKSGATNMFGAAPYIQREFGISNQEAVDLLYSWMKNFQEDGDYEHVMIDE